VRPRRKCGPHRLRAVAVRHMLGTVHVEEHRRRTGGGRRRVDSSSISILARPPGRGLIYAEARLREHRAAVANRLTTRPSARAHTHRSQLRGGARRAPATDGEPYSRSVTARGAGVARAPGEPACSLRRVTGPPSSSASSYETRRLRLAPQSSIKNLQSRNFFWSSWRVPKNQGSKHKMRGHLHSRALFALAAVSAVALACLVVHSRAPRASLLSKVRCF
jgi:hypothetical protein